MRMHPVVKLAGIVGIVLLVVSVLKGQTEGGIYWGAAFGLLIGLAIGNQFPDRCV